MRDKWVSILLLCCGVVSAGVCRGTLPIYIEDSHAGSFYWFAKTLPLDAPHTLVLFDRHCDASELMHSDYARREIRKARANGSTDSLCLVWRQHGFIQCFNWIEPLMPFPFSRVIWVPAPQVPTADYQSLRHEALKELSCHEEAVHRSVGDLLGAFHVCPINGIDSLLAGSSVVVTIDLDYFADYRQNLREHVTDLLNRVLEIPNLAAISVSVSTPYLYDKKQAYVLLSAFFERLSPVMNATFQFEPFETTGIDRSIKARALEKKGLSVPCLDVTDFPLDLKSLLLFLDNRLIVSCGAGRWNRLLEDWRQSAQIRVSASNHHHAECLDTLTNLVWKVLIPTRKQFNVAGDQGFSNSSGSLIEYKPVMLAAESGQRTIQTVDVSEFLNVQTGTGTVHVFAEGGVGNSRIRSGLLTLQYKRSSSYIGQLTGIINLPYVYGSSLLDASGINDFFGVDCANFIAYGRRSTGHEIPNCNPAQLRKFLRKLGTVSCFKNGRAVDSKGNLFPITKEMVDNGIVLHFRTHVGAILEDNPPTGLLDETDLIIHKLEDEPDVIPLGCMRHSNKPFDVMVFDEEDFKKATGGPL